MTRCCSLVSVRSNSVRSISPTLLRCQDACEVIKGFLARGDGDLRFSILALARTDESGV